MGFIGKKEYFGIEFMPNQKFSNKGGPINIWIDNFSFGYPLDGDFFFVVINALNHIVYNSEFFSELEGKSDEETLKIILQNDESGPNYDAATIQMGESFDDYIVRAVKTIDGNIKLIVAAAKHKSINLQTFNIISIILDPAYLIKIVEEFITEIKLINPAFEL
jgi:hypothetical protein